jgi:hypothetical protein
MFGQLFWLFFQNLGSYFNLLVTLASLLLTVLFSYPCQKWFDADILASFVWATILAPFSKLGQLFQSSGHTGTLLPRRVSSTV